MAKLKENEMIFNNNINLNRPRKDEENPKRDDAMIFWGILLAALGMVLIAFSKC